MSSDSRNMDIIDQEIIREAENVRLRLLYTQPLGLHKRYEELLNLMFQLRAKYTPSMRTMLQSLTSEANDLLLICS